MRQWLSVFRTFPDTNLMNGDVLADTKATRNSRDTACGPQRELNNVYLSFPNP